MEPYQIAIYLFLGFIAYWLVKVRGILKSYSRQNTFSDFIRDYLIEVLLSIVAVVFVGCGGADILQLPLTNPQTCFIAGGVAPAMLTDFMANIFKK